VAAACSARGTALTMNTVLMAKRMADHKLSRQKSFHSNSTLFVVATDGSRLAQRAQRLAACLMNTPCKDRIHIVTVASDVNDYEARQMCNNARADIINNSSIVPALVTQEVVKRESEEGVETSLCRSVEKLLTGGGGPSSSVVHVMGAAGRGFEDAEKSKGQRAHGQAPMGHVAAKCMEKCAASVILVKNNTTPVLESDHGMQQRKQMLDMGRITIVCAVDGVNERSTGSFDMAQHFARQGDSVHVLHVNDTDKAISTSNSASTCDAAVAQKFKGECDKATSASGNDVVSKFVSIPKKVSIKDSILQYSDDVAADLLILGSLQLAKCPTDGNTMGSVSAAAAKKSIAHILVAKGFGGF